MLQQQIITMLCCLLQHYGSPKHAAFACTAQVAEVYQSSGLRTILPIPAVLTIYYYTLQQLKTKTTHRETLIIIMVENKKVLGCDVGQTFDVQ